MTTTIIIIQSVIIFYLLIHFFHQKNVNRILKEKYRGFISASEDYSKYIKAYAGFYNEIHKYLEVTKEGSKKYEIIRDIITKFKRHFNHCEVKNYAE